jgi:excisionase family DNA binding protein
MTQWLKTADLAARLGVTARTVRAWVAQGLIPAVRIKPKVLRFDVAEVERALRARGGLRHG